MAIENIPLKNLQDNIRRYRARGLTEGGRYSLTELLQEVRRREVSPFPVVPMARAILEQSQASDDGLTTYKALWHAFTNKPWKGNASQAQIGKALGQVIAYCSRQGLPVITTLVVRSDTRQLAEEAIINIYSEAREYGYDVSYDAQKFVEEQRARARQCQVGQCPDEIA